MQSKMAVKVEMLVTSYKVAAILLLFFSSKISVYFKLNYFKLIHLQANMLSFQA